MFVVAVVGLQNNGEEETFFFDSVYKEISVISYDWNLESILKA